MSDATATGPAQAADPQSGQEPQTAAGATATPQAGEGQEGSEGTTATPAATADPAVLARELAEARREAAKHRTELKKRQDAEEAARQAAMSEAEKATAERDSLKAKVAELEAANRRLVADAEARDLGTKLGLVDYRDALALIPADQIETDDDGKPTNLETLFRELVKAKPYLTEKANRPAPPSTGAAAGTSGGRPPNLTADELDAAKRTGIAPERYAALKGVSTLADWQATRPKPS